MGVAILQPLWPMAGHYTACGGWRAATRPTSSHSRYVRKAYHSNSGQGWNRGNASHFFRAGSGRRGWRACFYVALCKGRPLEVHPSRPCRSYPAPARRSRRAGRGARVGASVVGGSEIGAQRIWWQERCLAREGCRARNDQADRRGPGHRSAKTWPRTRTRIWVSTRRRCSPWRRRWSMRPAKRMALRLLTRRWLRASPRRSSLPARSSGRGQRCRRWTRRRTR